MKLPKVYVGLSGGVDSSVAAFLLKNAGFEITGVYLKCYWTYEGCQSDQDRNSAARVASVLNIPFEVWDFEREYREKVVDYFYDEYKKGRTPNPDVVCNREIKFGLFLRKALNYKSQMTNNKQNSKLKNQKMEENAETTSYIATGHYARLGVRIQRSKIKDQNDQEEIVFPKFSQYEEVADINGVRYVGIEKFLKSYSEVSGPAGRDPASREKLALFGGVDSKKDQSYFLYDIPKSTYEHILYPLGSLTKKQVREIAKKENLPTAERPDSSGICFIGEVNVEKFLKERIKEKTGEVLDTKGNVIGSHKGVEFYTIGQRHGFQITNHKSQITNKIQKSKIKDQSDSLKFKSESSKLPYYVIGKNVEKNQLIVGMGEECKTDQFSVKIDRNLKFEILNLKLFVRIRNLGEMIPCQTISDKDKSDKLEVTLEYPVFGVAPGQSAVFYRAVVATDGASVTTQRLAQGVLPDDYVGAPPQRSLLSITSAQKKDANLHDVGSTVVWEVVGGGTIA